VIINKNVQNAAKRSHDAIVGYADKPMKTMRKVWRERDQVLVAGS
jgi:hypothetical protein